MDFGQIITAMVTPFDDNNQINFPMVTELMNYLISNGTDAIIVAGTTGESPTLTHQEKIDLTRHEFELLYFLMRHPNQILSREELIEQLYPNLEKTVLDRTIDAHIKKLRSKVETEAGKPHRIQTVRGMGYKFVTS